MSRLVEHDGVGRFRIRFPFDRSLVERIKALPNRRWHAMEKFWSVPESDVILLVEVLTVHGFRFDEQTVTLYEALGGSAKLETFAPPAQAGLFDVPAADGAESPEAGAGEPTDLSVAALNRQVQAVLTRAFPMPVWVVGEISGFNKNRHKRHIGFNLVEVDDAGGTVSQVGATLFEGSRRTIETKLAAAGSPFEMEDEISVRLLVRVELYVPWGTYRVIVEDLDVGFTLGEAARRREEIVRSLGVEGLLEKNSALPMPAVPLRVGLITSLGSDAYNDVMRTLQESGYAFEVTAHGARVQGKQTEPSVLNALDWFRARADRFDALLLCRGGGSRTDLSWFDTERLGRALAEFPIPVVSGIGHEQDHSVPDAVTRRAKTPTAAAAMMVDQVTVFMDSLAVATRGILQGARDEIQRSARRVHEASSKLRQETKLAFQSERHRMAQQQQRTVTAARSLLVAARQSWFRNVSLLPERASRTIERERDGLRSAGKRLGPSALRSLREQTQRLKAGARRLRGLDPQRVLERGYSILRTADGVSLTDARNAPAGATLSAKLQAGSLRLQVTDSIADTNERTSK